MFSWAMERKAKAFGGPRNALKIGLTGWPGPSPIFTDVQPPRPSLYKARAAAPQPPSFDPWGGGVPSPCVKSSGRACGCQCKFAVTPIYLAPSLQIDLSPHRGQFRGFWAKSGPETHRTGPRKVKEGCIYTFRAHPGPTTQGSSKTIARPMIFAPSVPITHYFVIQVSGSRLIYIYIYTHTCTYPRSRSCPPSRPAHPDMHENNEARLYMYIRRTNDLSTDSGQVALSRKPSQQARKQPTAHARRTPTST